MIVEAVATVLQLMKRMRSQIARSFTLWWTTSPRMPQGFQCCIVLSAFGGVVLGNRKAEELMDKAFDVSALCRTSTKAIERWVAGHARSAWNGVLC